MYCKGDNNVLKTYFVLLLAGAFLLSGIVNVLKQIRTTATLEEISRFISLVKSELHYRNADYEQIYIKAESQNYKYISFSDGKIFVNNVLGANLKSEFHDFLNKIGTTDEDGQLTLCDEYKSRFEDALINRKSKEKEKLQVNTALSVFGALTVLIFFL